MRRLSYFQRARGACQWGAAAEDVDRERSVGMELAWTKHKVPPWGSAIAAIERWWVSRVAIELAQDRLLAFSAWARWARRRCGSARVARSSC